MVSNSSALAMADWSELIEHSPVPTLVLQGSQSGEDRAIAGQILFASATARSLFSAPILNDLGSSSIFAICEDDCHGELTDLLAGSGDQAGEPIRIDLKESVTASGSNLARQTLDLHTQQLPSGTIMAQLTRCDGWLAVDRVLAEQQKFRSAVMELSELAHTAQDDEVFYQRLIERAVEVVPGAQAGSVQLVIPETAQFRFVAALGFDLEGLQQRVLERANFFRDAWDPNAQIVRDFDNENRSPEIDEWLETAGRLSEIVVNCSAPVLRRGLPVAFLSLDNFEDPDAMTETSVEMTTVLARLIGELWERRELEAQLRKEREAFRDLALRDALTGLANRRSLQRSLDSMLDAARGRGRPAAVLFVDIDDFKGVNDRLGHDVGDSLLTAVASGLASAVRAGDLVGRWGGDEFLVLPHRVETSAEALALADRILKHFEDAVDLGDEHLHRARVSVGVGWSPDSRVDSDGLVRAADEALYEAKAAGKGTSRLLKAEPDPEIMVSGWL